MYTESEIFTLAPPIGTSHRPTEDDIVCQPQLLRERETPFWISPSSVRKSIWYWFPQALPHSCYCESLYPQHIPHPWLSLEIHFLNFPSLHATPTLILQSAYTLHMPFPFPPCGHLNCPCRGVGSISIFTPSPTHFHPSSQCYASFICEAGWPIFSVWPHAAIVHRCPALSCTCTGPRLQLWVGQAELEWALQALTPIQSNPSRLVWSTGNLRNKEKKQNHIAARKRGRNRLYTVGILNI